jgi:hypothetical protein
MTKQIVSALSMVPVPEPVAVPFVHQFLDDETGVQAKEVMETAATEMFDALLSWESALRPRRAGATDLGA